MFVRTLLFGSCAGNPGAGCNEDTAGIALHQEVTMPMGYTRSFAIESGTKQTEE